MSRPVMVGAAVLLVVIVAGAAFAAAQMLGAQPTSAAGGGGGRQIQMKTSGPGGAHQANISFKPAPELPSTPSVAQGVLVRRKDNTVVVGTGQVQAVVQAEKTGQGSSSLSHSGPEVEVVVGRDIAVYKDTTKVSELLGAGKSGEVTLQQTVQRVDSLDEARDGGTEVEVWGEKRGDRIVATVVVYRLLAG